MKDYNLLDSMAGEKALKESLKTKAYEASNDLSRIAGIRSIADISKIQEIYKASDYAFMKDPLKYQNLDMKVNSTDKADGLVVCVVIVGGREMDFMINLSETNGLNKGDILRIDLDKEGKENQTIFSDDFLEHTSDKAGSLGKAVDAETILAGLGINNYEDIVREVNKRAGFQVDQKKAVEGINKNRGIGGNDVRDEVSEKINEEGKVEEEDKEFSLEEAAAQAGVSVDAIQKFCEKNGIDKITGISFTNDSEKLSQKLDYDLPQTENLIMVRASGINGKANSAFVIDQEGETLFEPGDTPNGESFLLDVVREGSNGEEVEDVAKAAEETNKIKIGESASGISVETSEIEGENLSDQSRIQLEKDIEQLMEKLDNEIQIIEDGPGTKLEKAKMVEERCINAHVDGLQLQDKYGVELPGLTDKTIDRANAAVGAAEQEEVKAAVGTVGKAAIGAVAAATGIKMFDDEKENDDRDPRESNHSHEHTLY